MRKCILLIPLLLTACGDGGDSGGPATALSPAPPVDLSPTVFDPATFATFTLTMDPADWDHLVETPSDDTYRRATMTWESDTVPDVAVRPSGVTTRIPGHPKPSLRIDFNEFVPDRKWRGINQIRLDAFVRDRTFMRDRLSYGVYAAMGVAAPRASHARLFVNGDYKGVYGVEETIKKDFVKRHWGENDGNLYETRHVQSSEPDPYRWRGPDVALYVPFPFEPKSNEIGGDHQDVVTLLDTLSNTSLADRRAELDSKILDVDKFLSYLAVLQALADYDGITASWGSNNHYWYRPSASSRLVLIPWDPEFSLGLFGMSPARSIWEGTPRTAAASWIRQDPVASPAFRGKIRQVFEGPMADFPAQIDFIYAQIRAAVQADPYKHGSQSEFDSGPATLKSWIQQRIQSLGTQVQQP